MLKASADEMTNKFNIGDFPHSSSAFTKTGGLDEKKGFYI